MKSTFKATMYDDGHIRWTKVIRYLVVILVILNIDSILSSTSIFVDASHYKYSYTISEYSPDPLVQFMYLEGGTFTIGINSIPQTKPLYFLLCTDTDWLNIFGYKISSPSCNIIQEAMESSSNAPTCLVMTNFTDSIYVNRTIDRYNRYYAGIIDCNDDTPFVPVNITLDMTLVNPDNNQLSAELIPASFMFKTIGFVWICVLIVWLYVFVQHLLYLVRIHYLMTLYPIFKIIICYYSAHVYNLVSIGDVSKLQIYFYHVNSIMFHLFFQMILLLLATGWSITQNSIKGDRFNVLALVSGLALCMILKDLFVQDNLSYLFVELFILSIRVFLLFYVFVAININSQQLEYRIHHYNPSQETQTSLTQEQVILVIKKYKLFVMLKLILLFWVTLITLEFFTALLLYGGIINNWVSMMNDQFLDLILFVCIGYNYRPRKDNIFKVLHFRDDTNSVVRDIGDEDDGGDNGIELQPI